MWRVSSSAGIPDARVGHFLVSISSSNNERCAPLANWEQAGANAQRYEQYQRQLRQRELEQVTGGCCRCCSCLVVCCRP